VYDINGSGNNMLTVCQWYSDEDKKWLWDSIWDVSFYAHLTCTLLGLLSATSLGITSCRLLRPHFFRFLSMLFGMMAVLSLTPFLIYWKSDMCLQDKPTCNDSQSKCVDSCQIGSGSWQLFAASFMWISSMLVTWSIPPIKLRNINEDIESQNCKRGKDSAQDCSNEKDSVYLSDDDYISGTSSGEDGSEEDRTIEENVYDPSL